MTRQRDNARDRYFCAPPENAATFHELFLFIWEHGVGNTLAGPGGPGIKWTRESLAIALNEAASPRSIDDWRSGARVPSDTNVRMLLSVVSEASTRGEWQRILINAAAEAREKIDKMVMEDTRGPIRFKVTPPRLRALDKLL